MSPLIQVVRPSGILDGPHAPQFRHEINELVAGSIDLVLIDFQDVTFMDSSGLNTLIWALKTIRATGGKLFLCSINEQIRMLFELESMDRVFEIFPTREDFERKHSRSS